MPNARARHLKRNGVDPDTATCSMTLREAAKLVNRTERTISRWKADGCPMDEKSLLRWSEEKDVSARGEAKNQWMQREDDITASRSKKRACPASTSTQNAVYNALEDLLEEWHEQVDERDADYLKLHGLACEIYDILNRYD
jgi:hypothetical protein